MTLQDKVKTIKHCTTNTECEGCPAFIIKDGDRRCTLPGSTDELALSVIRELTEPATREELWRMNIDALAAGAYGDPKDPATLVRYWHDQAHAGFPGAMENLRFFDELAAKTRPQTAAEISQQFLELAAKTRPQTRTQTAAEISQQFLELEEQQKKGKTTP